GRGAAGRLATSTSRGGGRGARDFAGATSGGGGLLPSADRTVDLASGSSPPPIIRSNLANGSVVALVVGSAEGDSVTRPSGSLASAVAGGELALLAADEVASIGSASVAVDSADDSGDDDADVVGDDSGETAAVAG